MNFVALYSRAVCQRSMALSKLKLQQLTDVCEEEDTVYSGYVGKKMRSRRSMKFMRPGKRRLTIMKEMMRLNLIWRGSG